MVNRPYMICKESKWKIINRATASGYQKAKEEIEESLDDIKKYCTDRPETQSIELIDEPLDSVGKAIRNKNVAGFKSGYLLLTNTCNSCHQATDHGFNVITVPTTPPFSNQVFKPKNEK